MLAAEASSGPVTEVATHTWLCHPAGIDQPAGAGLPVNGTVCSGSSPVVVKYCRAGVGFPASAVPDARVDELLLGKAGIVGRVVAGDHVLRLQRRNRRKGPAHAARPLVLDRADEVLPQDIAPVEAGRILGPNSVAGHDHQDHRNHRPQ